MRVLVAALAVALLPALGVLGPSVPADQTASAEPAAPPQPADLPRTIDGGAWPTSHVQGVAVDREQGVVYWSFTQMLVKTDLQGDLLGTVTGLTGHLGDLTLNPDDGRVYGSLEYKDQEAFYIAVFDGAAIDREEMDAEADGVMTTVHLEEVVQDFTADLDRDGRFDGDVADTADHRYGSSGIDGVSFGPPLGDPEGEPVLMVAYGVYENVDREDNDHQVLLQYDVSGWPALERPLSQEAPHRSGPDQPDRKVFVHTGNTRYGVQNLSYDEHTGYWLMAVYRGSKAAFPNYSLYAVDGAVSPRRTEVVGQARRHPGLVAPLLEAGLEHQPSGVRGFESEGSYGLESLGDGYFYLVTGERQEVDGEVLQDATATLHRWTGAAPTPFEVVS